MLALRSADVWGSAWSDIRRFGAFLVAVELGLVEDTFLCRAAHHQCWVAVSLLDEDLK